MKRRQRYTFGVNMYVMKMQETVAVALKFHKQIKSRGTSFRHDLIVLYDVTVGFIHGLLTYFKEE